MQSLGYVLQSVLHRNLSQVSQPIGGLLAKPLFNVLAVKISNDTVKMMARITSFIRSLIKTAKK